MPCSSYAKCRTKPLGNGLMAFLTRVGVSHFMITCPLSCSAYVWGGSVSLLLHLIAVFSTDRVIAMSFPSSGKQSFYRNPIKVKISPYQIRCF